MRHILYPVEELVSCMNARAFIQDQHTAIRTLLTDSRKLSNVSEGLFFAIKSRRDGHTFIADAYRAGVRSFVISDPGFDRSPFAACNFYLVDDALNALQALAAAHRAKFNYPVIGITGSNGKTIVKEWLHQLLAPFKNIVRSPKSYNSQLGVPVSVWEMAEENDLAIFEAGISRSGEMETLASVIQPTIGILTTIGEAHQEGFKNRDEKIREKLKLFEGVDLLIYPDKYLDQYEDLIPGKEKFTWSYHHPADLEIYEEGTSEGKYQKLRAKFRGAEIEALIPFKDQASVENAIICWATLLALGYSPEETGKRLGKLLPIGMRLELKHGINNCSVIDDSYSLDLSSLAIALDFLNQQNQHLRRTLILSDIPGGDSGSVYTQIARMLESKSVDRLIGVGEHISKYAAGFNCEKQFYRTTEELIDAFPSLQFADETVLLKGARVFEFERISQMLTQKVHETVMEINLNALEHNLNYYKGLLAPGTKVMAMVKAFSYGSGSFEITNLLEFNGVDYLAVAYADEGVALRKAGTTLPIVVMSPDSLAFDAVIDYRLEPEIYSLRIFEEFLETLSRKGLASYPIHIKLDTGMHRLGFMENELDPLLEYLRDNKLVHVKSIFSHLVASEDEQHDEFTKQQIELFSSLSDRIEVNLNYPVLRHLSNTSGISRWPEAAFDMVRLGIGLYGIDPVHAGTGDKSPLQTVTSLKTSISQIKHIPPGDTIGYGREGKMPAGGTIATVKIGYADGYSRRLGNGAGKMLLHGREVKTIGKICMDMCMIDITGVKADEGDEVIVFNDKIRVEDLAVPMDTIAYEVLTGISQRVKRVYYYE